MIYANLTKIIDTKMVCFKTLKDEMTNKPSNINPNEGEVVHFKTVQECFKISSIHRKCLGEVYHEIYFYDTRVNKMYKIDATQDRVILLIQEDGVYRLAGAKEYILPEDNIVIIKDGYKDTQYKVSLEYATRIEIIK